MPQHLKCKNITYPNWSKRHSGSWLSLTPSLFPGAFLSHRQCPSVSSWEWVGPSPKPEERAPRIPQSPTGLPATQPTPWQKQGHHTSTNTFLRYLICQNLHSSHIIRFKNVKIHISVTICYSTLWQIIASVFRFYWQTEKSQSPSSKSGNSSPSHHDPLTPGPPGPPGPSTSCLRLVNKAASSADPLGKTSVCVYSKHNSMKIIV